MMSVARSPLFLALMQGAAPLRLSTCPGCLLRTALWDCRSALCRTLMEVRRMGWRT